jgi:hypothetical protein
MIKFTGNNFECDCGNKNPDKFNKFIHNSVVIGERNRKKVVKNYSIICTKCETVLTNLELNLQLLAQKIENEKEVGKEVGEKEKTEIASH